MFANSQELRSFETKSPGNRSFDATSSIVRDRQSPFDLKVLSWPPGKELPEWGILKRFVPYIYEKGVPGRGDIYIIDSGVYIQHRVRTSDESSRETVLIP